MSGWLGIATALLGFLKILVGLIGRKQKAQESQEIELAKRKSTNYDLLLKALKARRKVRASQLGSDHDGTRDNRVSDKKS